MSAVGTLSASIHLKYAKKNKCIECSTHSLSANNSRHVLSVLESSITKINPLGKSSKHYYLYFCTFCMWVQVSREFRFCFFLVFFAAKHQARGHNFLDERHFHYHYCSHHYFFSFIHPCVLCLTVVEMMTKKSCFSFSSTIIWINC